MRLDHILAVCIRLFLVSFAVIFASCSEPSTIRSINDSKLSETDAAAAELKTLQPAQSIYWSDGDSGRLTLPGGDVVKFRLDDWDAPETGGVGAAIGGAKCEAERARGFEAKAYMVNNSREDVFYSHDGEYDGYERLLIGVSAGGLDLVELAAAEDHIRSWRHDGKKALEPRPDWCG